MDAFSQDEPHGHGRLEGLSLAEIAKNATQALAVVVGVSGPTSSSFEVEPLPAELSLV
jgi:hypothetical protein